MTQQAGWYAVALADDIEPGSATGTRLFGRELVVWRDDAGQSHVWQDRCPHRGTRLSFGFVRGSQLACLYHGWQFDGAGRCRYIPAHPRLEVPASITVERFVSAERWGLVWVFSGEAAAGTAPPGGDAGTVPIRSLAVAAPIAEVVAALEASRSPFGDTGLPIHEAAGGVLAFGTGSQRLYVAVQPNAAADTTLHLVAEPGVDRHGISLWAEALRRSVETDHTPARGVA